MVLVMVFLYWARAVLVPLALATLFAFILTPAVSFLQRHSLRRLPSVLIVVVFAFSLLGGIGYIVGNQLAGLARRLPDYKGVISAKIESVTQDDGGGPLDSLRQTVRGITSLAATADGQTATDTQEDGIPEVPRGSTADKPLYTKPLTSSWSGFADYAGSAAEFLASGLLVLVLVVFMLVQREDLRNRIVRLIGHGQLIVTTRAIDEGARRISSFLLMQLLVNAGFGLALTCGLVFLSFFGLTPADGESLRRYALLWGFLCGLMRFIPYLGTWIGGALLFGFAVATLHGWTLPLVIFAVFIALELLAANAIEPLLFGHSTGISPLALLLSAAFWAWLWGPVGLLLSIPLTVVLIMIGKYVPEMHFLEVFLGDEPVLRPHVILYQRLVARDLDEASDLVEEYLKNQTIEETYQELLLPALLLARQDFDRGELHGDKSRDLYRSIRDLLDDFAPPTLPQSVGEKTEAAVVLGCPARDEVDELALLMFGNLLRTRGRSIELVSSTSLTAEVLEKAGRICPAVVVIASVAPSGIAQARYLCKRLKAQCPGIKVVVGRWGHDEDQDRVQARLKQSGADVVGTTLTETRSEVVPLLQVAETSDSVQQHKAEVALAMGR
jgi:predicted PurR-regulated permease PerM